jgi:hypothetical protein
LFGEFFYHAIKNEIIEWIPMTRSRINGNFIDKTFTIVANILLRIIPTTSGEKEAFTYYRDGAI